MRDRKIPTGYVCQLKQYRLQRQLTQDELARDVACSRETIRNIETRRHIPYVLLGLRISSTLGIPLEQVFFIREEVDHAAAQT